MACSKCQKKTGPCGCKDTPYTTVIPKTCETNPQCPEPEICSEYVDTNCVVGTFGLPNFYIQPGDNLMQILQKLDLFHNNPACIDPDSDCLATTYVYPINITQTTIEIAWLSVDTALNYIVEFKEADALVWSTLPSTTALSTVISTLTADTLYYIRVSSICTIGSCYSSTISVQTLA